MNERRTSLTLALLALAWMLLLPRTAHAQLRWPTVTPSVEVGIGYTGMAWERNELRDEYEHARSSYLPEVALSSVLPVELDTGLVLQPHLGLQFDGVSRSNDDGQGYDDHFAITSVRAGLMLLVHSESVVVGFGPEYRKPIWVRASLRSRGKEGFEWVLYDDPDILHEGRFYWTFRLGFPRAWGYFSFDVSIDNGEANPFAMVLPDNPLQYTSLRLNLHLPLYRFGR